MAEVLTPPTEALTVRKLRCIGCHKLLAELVTAPWLITCRGCGRISTAGDVDGTITIAYTMAATP